MISAAQKKAKDNFKKAIAYRKKTGCDLKAAFAHVYGRKVGAVKKKAAPKKKGAKLVIKSTRKKSTNAKDKIKDVLKSEKKRLKHGYTIVPGRVMNGISTTQVQSLQKAINRKENLENILQKLKQIKLSNRNQQTKLSIKNIPNLIKQEKEIITIIKKGIK